MRSVVYPTVLLMLMTSPEGLRASGDLDLLVEEQKVARLARGDFFPPDLGDADCLHDVLQARDQALRELAAMEERGLRCVHHGQTEGIEDYASALARALERVNDVTLAITRCLDRLGRGNLGLVRPNGQGEIASKLLRRAARAEGEQRRTLSRLAAQTYERALRIGKQHCFAWALTLRLALA